MDIKGLALLLGITMVANGAAFCVAWFWLW